MISFVLDVAGKTQSSLPIPLHLSFRTDGGGRSSCSDGLRSDINEDHAEHSPAQAYVVKGTKCAIALVAQSDSERWSTEPEVAGSNPAKGTAGCRANPRHPVPPR